MQCPSRGGRWAFKSRTCQHVTKQVPWILTCLYRSRTLYQRLYCLESSLYWVHFQSSRTLISRIDISCKLIVLQRLSDFKRRKRQALPTYHTERATHTKTLAGTIWSIVKSYSTSNSHTPALYRQPPKKSFRLIQLLPGSWNDPLDTELLGPFVYLRPVISIRQSFPLLMAKPLTMLPYSTLGGIVRRQEKPLSMGSSNGSRQISIFRWELCAQDKERKPSPLWVDVCASTRTTKWRKVVKLASCIRYSTMPLVSMYILATYSTEDLDMEALGGTREFRPLSILNGYRQSLGRNLVWPQGAWNRK